LPTKAELSEDATRLAVFPELMKFIGIVRYPPSIRYGDLRMDF
jgi:hypothetical protein